MKKYIYKKQLPFKVFYFNIKYKKNKKTEIEKITTNKHKNQ